MKADLLPLSPGNLLTAACNWMAENPWRLTIMIAAACLLVGKIEVVP